MKYAILTTLCLTIGYLGSNAQSLNSFGNVDKLFQMYADDQSGGAADAKRYLEGYLSPALNGLGFGVSGGWFNSAAPHKPAGFDITTTLTLAVVPDADKAFSMANANTVDVNGDVPTVMGSEVPPVFTLKSDGTTTFEGLPGFGTRMEDAIGYAVIPTPMAQIGVGLPMNTEAKIRFIPRVDVDGLSMSMWGLGVMHDIKQYIPGIKLSPFDLSFFLGYTRLNLRNEFNTQNARDGEIIFGFNSWNYQAIVSKKLSVITFYAGIGASNTGLNLKINGEYDIDNDTSNGYELKDPIDIGLGAFGSRMTVGFRLKLAVITIHADYTLQKYDALSVGVGVSIR